jgi:hypothetical protein
MKRQRLQNKVLRTIDKFPRNAAVRDMHISFQQAQVVQHHEKLHVRNIGQGEARHRKYKRLELGSCQANDRSSDETCVAI